MAIFEETVVSVELPATISRKVVYTENAARRNANEEIVKPAKLSKGTEIQVADYIKMDEWVSINIRHGSFKGRSKK